MATIPILLLKTKSQPHDVYEEYFAASVVGAGNTSTDIAFEASFVPVLEHRPHTQNLSALKDLLRNKNLSRKYGGMIFTSQRAVEAWSDIVKGLGNERQNLTIEIDAQEIDAAPGIDTNNKSPASAQPSDQTHTSLPELSTVEIPFPIYTVGPATSRALHTLVNESATSNISSPFAGLNPKVLGEQTGNGAALARYMLTHYNVLHSNRYFTFYEAPRLPFIPLMGTSGNKRLEQDDPRLQKKPVLFLVGETRRDVIPKTLMDPEGKLDAEQRIQVDEVEVYATDVMKDFERNFQEKIQSYRSSDEQSSQKTNKVTSTVVVVVVFSPQGCDAMLRSLGFVDEAGRLSSSGSDRWMDDDKSATATSRTETAKSQRYIVATIGPTTRDYVKDKFGFVADVCAKKPSPEGIGEGVTEFLKSEGLI